MESTVSARSVQTIKTPGYHRCGPGLYLQVTPSSTKTWVFRFKSPITGKQREMGLGSLTILNLAKARERAIECRQVTLQGLDPIDERNNNRRLKKIEQYKTVTFAQAAEKCIDSKRHEWKNVKHGQQWVNTLRTYAFPTIGELPLSNVDTDLVLKIIEPIWVTKAETASRIRQRIETVWDWGKARGYVKGENPARLKGHIDKILSRTSKIKKVKHHPALPFNKIHTFIKELRQQKGSSSLALEFMVLTAARTSEVIKATWSEIDLAGQVWTIPANRMKAGREHRVPLSKRAIKILLSIKTGGNSTEYIFPGWKIGSCLSNGAMLVLMDKMNYGEYTPHGMRSCFRDWTSEVARGFQNETLELALAHTIKNKSEQAYRRGDQLELRRALMDKWAEYIETEQITRNDNLILLNRA